MSPTNHSVLKGRRKFHRGLRHEVILRVYQPLAWLANFHPSLRDFNLRKVASPFWAAAGSIAPRRFRTHDTCSKREAHPPLESGVAAPALTPHSKTRRRHSPSPAQTTNHAKYANRKKSLPKGRPPNIDWQGAPLCAPSWRTGNARIRRPALLSLAGSWSQCLVLKSWRLPMKFYLDSNPDRRLA